MSLTSTVSFANAGLLSTINVQSATLASVTSTAPQITTLISAGQRGEPGPAGVASLTATAATPLAGHKVVALTKDGFMHASADNINHILAVVGLTESSFSQGSAATAKSSGNISLVGWNWSPGPVLLGLDGALTQTIPPTAEFVQAVGFGDGDTITINILQPYEV